MPADPSSSDPLPTAACAADPTASLPTSLPPAAQRALAEAEARRHAAPPAPLPEEIGGRDGPEPVRYGDYERKGIAVDF